MVSFDIIFFPFQNSDDIKEYIALDLIVAYMQYPIQAKDPVLLKLVETGYDIFFEESHHTFNMRVNGYGDKVPSLFQISKDLLSNIVPMVE